MAGKVAQRRWHGAELWWGVEWGGWLIALVVMVIWMKEKRIGEINGANKAALEDDIRWRRGGGAKDFYVCSLAWLYSRLSLLVLFLLEQEIFITQTFTWLAKLNMNIVKVFGYSFRGTCLLWDHKSLFCNWPWLNLKNICLGEAHPKELRCCSWLSAQEWHLIVLMGTLLDARYWAEVSCMPGKF